MRKNNQWHRGQVLLSTLLTVFLVGAPGLDTVSAELPGGFLEETLATGLNAATAMVAAPDGRIFIADQTGPLRIWKNGRLLPAPAIDLGDRLDTYWERGFVGLALHPDFPRSPHLFLLYVARAPYTHHVISRFTVVGDRVDPASEQVLLEGDDQSKLGGKVPGGHQGGPMCFGADGKLYVGLGEQTAGMPSQSLATLQGKILRLNPDGTIPMDNPFYNLTTGKYRAIWTLGMRNPFGLAVEPGTGRLFESDVGEAAFEEVNEIVRGGNYGWPQAEGYSTNAAFRNPIYAYPHAIGRCIVGATFYPRRSKTGSVDELFPEKWRGKLFFADWSDNWVKALDPASPTNVLSFAKGFNGPVAVEATADGALLVLNRGTIWRDGKKWQPNTGSLVRIRYTGVTPVQAEGNSARPRLPQTLATSKLFRSLKPLEARDGLIEYHINVPPWQPGIAARRWISLPPASRLGVNADGEFEFPTGTLVVQQYFVAKTGAPFETHVFWFTGPRAARAAAYRWNADGTDGAFVEDGEVISLPGDSGRRWYSPGSEENLNLDMVVSGFLLPLNPRQCNRGDQLAQWISRGWLDRGALAKAASRLVGLDDSSAPLETRVRSYLDVNCSACHRPGGISRGNFDARFAIPLSKQNLLNGELVTTDLGIPGGRIIVPGHPERSIMLRRLSVNDFSRMPPVSVNDEAQPIAPVLKEWIQQIAGGSK